MNLVGKIFVFLIMVMSICFAMLAVGVFMTQNNWRDKVVLTTADLQKEEHRGKVVGLNQQLAEAKKQKDDLDAKHKELEKQYQSEVALERQAKIKAENEKVLLAAKNVDLLGNVAKLKENEAKSKANLEIAQNQLTERIDQVKAGEKKIVEARATIDGLFNQIVKITEANHGVAMANRNLKTRNEQLEAQLVKQQDIARRMGWNLDTPLDHQGPIEGFVTNVRTIERTIWVQVSVGRDDGLREGHVLSVFRGSTPLGRVVITEVRADTAAGRVEGARGQIQIRDQVESEPPRLQTAGVPQGR